MQLLLMKAVEPVVCDLSSLYIHGSFIHGTLEFCIQSVGVEPLTLHCSFSSLCQFFFSFFGLVLKRMTLNF